MAEPRGLLVKPTRARVRADARQALAAQGLAELGMTLHRRLLEKGRYLRTIHLDDRASAAAFDADTRELLVAYADVFDTQLALMAEEPDGGTH